MDQLQIAYSAKGSADLDLIESLWEKLRAHHGEVSHYFKDHYSRFTFAMRKKGLLDKTRQGALRIDLVTDQNIGKYVGYCVTSLTGEKIGEIESIYIEPQYRRSGIGSNLMLRALRWLDDNQASRKILGVAEGNESVFEFYRRFGFYPRIIVLEQKGDWDGQTVCD